MKVLIATKNQGKIEGAQKALLQYFDNVDIEGIPVESNVSEQPVNDEIYAGAKNRVRNLKLSASANHSSVYPHNIICSFVKPTLIILSIELRHSFLFNYFQSKRNRK